MWWNFEGIIHFELLPEGQVLNSEVFCLQLERMHYKLAKKYPALINRKNVLLHHDNARPHTSRMTKQKITELPGIELIPHPAYSPDLAPSDYHLFRSMSHFLCGQHFANINDVEKGCFEFLALNLWTGIDVG